MAKGYSSNAVLPLFELEIREKVTKERFSLGKKSCLQHHWIRCLEHFYRTGERRSEPFQIPKVNDYHFCNGQMLYKPAETWSDKGNFKFKSAPGPGFDHIGEKIVPNEFQMKRTQKPATGNHHQTNKAKDSNAKHKNDDKLNLQATKPQPIIPRKVTKQIRTENITPIIPDVITPSVRHPISCKRTKTPGHKGGNVCACEKTTIQVTEEATVKVNQKENKIVVQNKCTVAMLKRQP